MDTSSSSPEAPKPRRRPGLGPLLGFLFLCVAVSIALVLLLGHSASSPGLSAKNPRGLYQMDWDGSHKKLLLAGFSGSWPVAARGGVVFLGQPESGPLGTVFSQLSGGKVRSYAVAQPTGLWRPDPTLPLAWSQDRRQVLVVVRQTVNHGGAQPATGPRATERLYLARVKDGWLLSVRSLARVDLPDAYSEDGIVGLSWSRSDRAAYVVRQGGQSQIYLVDRPDHGGRPRLLAGNVALARRQQIALSADGRRLAYVSAAGPQQASELHILDVNSLETKTIEGAPLSGDYYGQSGAIAWSPDGSKLVFSASAADGVHVYLYDFKSGKLRQLTQSALQGGREEEPSFSLDGKHILYVASRGYEDTEDPFPLP